MKELSINEIQYVSGAGSVSEGMVGVALAGTAGLGSGAIAGALWGARAGGLVGAGVGALVGIGYVLATSGGGAGTRFRNLKNLL